MLRFVLVVSTLAACYQRDEQADSDALARFGKEQAATHRAPQPASGPAVLASIDLPARRAAVDGAWLVPTPPGWQPLAVELHGDRATLVDEHGAHDARVQWRLPCEVELTYAIDPRTDGTVTLEVVPVDGGARLVFGDVVAEQVGDTTISCQHGTLYVLDAAGACTHWLGMSSGDWLHATDDCSSFAALPADGPRRWSAETRARVSVREPDLAAASAARDLAATRAP